jgi:hypothetical protein
VGNGTEYSNDSESNVNFGSKGDSLGDLCNFVLGLFDEVDSWNWGSNWSWYLNVHDVLVLVLE